jgi:rhodanese-related sulfurtransferase
MNLISREELKIKLDRDEDIKLVFVLGEWQYLSQHIPGSLNIHRKEDVAEYLDMDDEIVVYCASEICPASIYAYHYLVSRGFKNVRRYAGGLEDWATAGYPLEGAKVAVDNSRSFGELQYQGI